MKESTKQRFAAIEFGYPDAAAEAEIVRVESGIGAELAVRLVQVAQASRNLKGHALAEGLPPGC